MEQKIFREESVERASSPERLNDYIRVTSPGVWLLLGAIAALLAGALLFAAFGRLETKLRLSAGADGAALYVAEARAAEIRPGMPVRAEGAQDAGLTVASVADEPVRAEEALGAYAMERSGFEPGDWVRPVTLSAPLPEGTREASVTLESVSALSFLLN